MALIEITDLSFTYPKQPEKSLDSVSLSVDEGEFVLLCGESGSGKSTLLRHIKRELTPFGRRSGGITYRGKPLESLDGRAAASEIGFVMQNPDNQIVTDKVWHELAFGLESIGLEQGVIRRRVAEMASFFGIQQWFHKDVAELSGGQKQMLNLASVMAMQPRVLILDEPTSQLDPIASADFLETVKRINRELAVTVILTEQRLEEVFPAADKIAVMEKGRVVCTGAPREVADRLSNKDSRHAMFMAFPAAVRIYAQTGSRGECPLTVREGRRWLSEHYGGAAGRATAPLPVSPAKAGRIGEKPAVELSDVWFRYEKNGHDILKGVSLKAYFSEITCILGGNGTGKTTSLNVMSGLLKAYRGKIRIFGKNLSSFKAGELYRNHIGLLPQNPQALFVRDTLGEDLSEVADECGERRESLNEIAEKMGLFGLMGRHPYDLSGGEQQKAAFAKILLRNPKIILLDEPTKGLDAKFKASFAEILRGLARKGAAVVMATHDVEFAAEYADKCLLFFDGAVVSQDAPVPFFSGNSFYTTAANRMSRHLFRDAVTCEDVIRRCLSI